MDGMNHKKKIKKQEQRKRKECHIANILVSIGLLEYVTSLVSDIIEPLVNSMKIIARRYQLGAVEWSLILTT